MNHTVRYHLDEFPTAVGRMQCIDDALVVGRGFGVRIDFYAQGIGQIKALYPDGGETVLLANTDCQVFAQVRDVVTAEYLEGRIGDQTIIVRQEQRGSSSSFSQDGQGMGSRQWGSNSGDTTSETGRKLYKKEEIMALGEREALVFVHGVPAVIRTRLVRYYEPEFKSLLNVKSVGQPSPLMRAVGLFVMAVAAAVAATAFFLAQ